MIKAFQAILALKELDQIESGIARLPIPSFKVSPAWAKAKFQFFVNYS